MELTERLHFLGPDQKELATVLKKNDMNKYYVFMITQINFNIYTIFIILVLRLYEWNFDEKHYT